MIYYITRGLPASGKTTFANSLGVDNVGRDWIRQHLFNAGGQKLEQRHEERVTRFQASMIADRAVVGRSVVADEMNLRPKYLTAHLKAASRKGFDPVVIDFRPVPLLRCIERDSERPLERQIGEEVIRNLYDTYVKDVRL